MSLALIPYLIFKKRTKGQIFASKIIQMEAKLNIKITHYDAFKKTRFNKYKFFSLLTVFDFLQTLITYLFCMNFVYNLWTFEIIFISLFSYFILKTEYYRHQYLSMIIILFLGAVLNIIEYFKLDKTEERFNLLEIFMKFFSEILISLNGVLSKYNMEKNYCSPYEICSWEGILGIILLIIGLVIINSLKLVIDGILYPDNFYSYFGNYDINDFIICIMVIIVSFIYNISIFLTCDYFSPVHILITSIIKESYYYMHINKNIALNLLGILTLILILFMFLVFIEIIELNIFNISYNTKKNIEIRSKLDSFSDPNNILNSNEDLKVYEDDDLLFEAEDYKSISNLWSYGKI